MALRPDSSVPRRLLGVSLIDAGELDAAIAVFHESLRREPQDFGAHFELGFAYGAKGDEGAAIESYKRALAIRTDNKWLYNNLANAFEKQGKLDDAAASWRKAIELDQENAGFRRHLGSVLRLQRKWLEAIQAYHEALELYPRDKLAEYFLGVVLRQARDLDGAIDEFHKAIALDPEYADAFEILGTSLALQGKFEESNAALLKAIEINPLQAGAMSDLAWTMATAPDERVRNSAKALELAERAVAIDSTVGNYQNTLGVARYRNGDWTGCIEVLGHSMRLRGGGKPDDWLYLAMAQQKLGDFDKAREWYERSAKWIASQHEVDEELMRFKLEAEQELGLKSTGDK
jgi:tetratricopeptide (TPR) repeat protein